MLYKAFCVTILFVTQFIQCAGPMPIPTEYKKVAAEEISIEELQDFLDHYKPTQENCGPTVKPGSAKPVKGLSAALESSLSCMVEGHKLVYLGKYKEFKDLTKTAKKLIKKHAIQAIHIPEKKEIIVYMPAGKINAFLMVQALLEGLKEDFSSYLMGKLFDYPEDAIHAFYTRLGKTLVLQFDDHKKQAEAWIEANKDTAEKWVKEHAKKWSLEFDINKMMD